MAKRKAGKRRSTKLVKTEGKPARPLGNDSLLRDIRGLIEESRRQVARTVNSALVWLNWNIGNRIRAEILLDKRAEYGKQIVSALGRQLTEEYGRGYTEKALWRMIQFAERFPNSEIIATLSRELSWSHFVEILPLDDPLKRDFYAEMSSMERWSVRTLRHQIDRLLYERTAVSKKPDELIVRELEALRKDGELTPDLVFRDPYFLDFLGLSGHHDERDMEQAILRELEAFILELGSDFAFVARQKRITVDSEDYYLDLLFYHRRLRRLVAIDLKLGKFRAADKGQMELSLRWLEKHDTQPGEEPPIRLLLCADKSEEHVELLRLEKSGIRVAAYMIELPPRELLQRKLHEAIRRARQRLVADGRGALPASKGKQRNHTK
jgi:predicted nuclease of restriction endonuclease-like (RecB) superfamily